MSSPYAWRASRVVGTWLRGVLHTSKTESPRQAGPVARVSGRTAVPPAKRRWVPPSTLRHQDALGIEAKHDLIFRKVRGILNKLTPEKFQKLSDDLLALELDSSKVLKGVILLIFEKALDEPKYSSMYAQLCKRLSEEAPNFEPPDRPCTFRLLLLNKCRSEFDNRTQALDAFEKDGIRLSPEDEERRHLAKCKMLGNIKFIGELGKLEILAETILHICIQQLLRSGTSEQQEDLECLAQLVRTCGRVLDSPRGLYLVDQYFARMETLSRNRELAPRIRFMLRDVLELRRSGWVPRKAVSSEGPVPIGQLRGDDELLGYRARDPPPPDPLFRHGLKTRAGLVDDMLSGLNLSSPSTNLVPPPTSDKFPFSPNGFGSGRNEGRDGYRHRGGGYNYQRNQGGYNKHHQNNNNNSNSKEVAPRFNKSRMLPAMGGVEELQMRPAANSLLYKANNLKPPSTTLPLSNPPIGMRPLSGSSVGSVLSSSNSESYQINKPAFTPAPSLLKEPAITIKPASDKTNKLKKDKGPNKEETIKQVVEILNTLVACTKEEEQPLIDENEEKEQNGEQKENGAAEEEKVERQEMQEAINNYRELKVPDKFAKDLALKVMEYALDKPEHCGGVSISLLGALRRAGLLPPLATLDALRTLLPTTPHTQLACLLTSTLTQNLCSLSDIVGMTENGAHYPLFLMVLQEANKTLGKQKLTEMYNSSKINLMTMVPAAERTKERLAETLEVRGLTFLCPLLRVQTDLARQLASEPAPAPFYRWLRANVPTEVRADPAFLSALVTVLLKYITQESTMAPGVPLVSPPDKALAEKEKDLTRKYAPVLQAFLEGKPRLQLLAIYALQVYCYSLNFPKGMLLRWFMSLYNLEICEEEAFFMWREDVTDAYPGKGEALFQVNAWLTWLEQQESESDEADE